MQNKQAIIILSIIFLLAAMFFAALFFNKQKQEDTVLEHEVFNIQELVDKKNQEQGLSEKQEKYLEKAILNKLEQKTQELKQKPKEEIISSGYTQEELDFMANPRKTTEEELGIEQEEKEIKFYTQEELDSIANPQ